VLEHASALAVIGIPIAILAAGASLFLEGEGPSAPMKGKGGVSLQPGQPGGLISTQQESVRLVLGTDSTSLVCL